MRPVRRWGVLCIAAGVVFFLKGWLAPASPQSNIVNMICLMVAILFIPIPERIGRRNLVFTLTVLFSLFFLLAAVITTVPQATGVSSDFVMAAVLGLLGGILILPQLDIRFLDPK